MSGRVQSYVEKLLSALSPYPLGLKGLELMKESQMRAEHYVLARRMCLEQKLIEGKSAGPRRTTRYLITRKGVRQLEKKKDYSSTVGRFKFDFGSESDLTIRLGVGTRFEMAERYLIPHHIADTGEDFLIGTLRGISSSYLKNSSIAKDVCFDFSIHVRAPTIDRSLFEAYIFLQDVGEYLNKVRTHFRLVDLQSFDPLACEQTEKEKGKLVECLKECLIIEYFIRSPDALLEIFLVANYFDSLGYSVETPSTSPAPPSWLLSDSRKFVSLRWFSMAKWRTIERAERERILKNLWKLRFGTRDEVKQDLSISPQCLLGFRSTRDCNDMTILLSNCDPNDRKALEMSLPPYNMRFKYVSADGKFVDLGQTIRNSREYKIFQQLQRNVSIKSWVTRIMSKFEYDSILSLGHWITEVPWGALGITPLGAPMRNGSKNARWHPINSFLFADSKVAQNPLGPLRLLGIAVAYDDLRSLKNLFEWYDLDDRNWPLLWSIFEEMGNRIDVTHAHYIDQDGKVALYPEDWRSQELIKKLLDRASEGKWRQLRAVIVLASKIYEELYRRHGWSHKQSIRQAISEACKKYGIRRPL